MSAHTPWTARTNGHGVPKGWAVDGPQGVVYNLREDEARLIAAAPEMLEFIRAVAETFEHTDARLGALARDLVARATGEA